MFKRALDALKKTWSLVKDEFMLLLDNLILSFDWSLIRREMILRTIKEAENMQLSKESAIAVVEKALIHEGFNISRTRLACRLIENRAGKYWYFEASYRDKQSVIHLIDLYVELNTGKLMKVYKTGNKKNK
mgnify:CR=1 FL=1